MPKKQASSVQVEAMFAAVEAGDVAHVKRLLAAGVDADVRNDNNITPLILAAVKGHEAVFHALVAAGANLHATRGYGDSVLFKAITGKEPARLRMVQAIIADGLVPDDGLPNAFSYACYASSVEVIRALLGAGADANHESLPLWWAVESNRPEIAAELIRAGADVNVRVPRKSYDDNKHARKTFLEAALDEGFTEVATILEAAGAKRPIKKPAPNRPARPAPIADTLKRIAAWLKTNAPAWKPVTKGATDAQIAAAEKKLGFKLPAELRELYLAHNGSPGGQIFPCADDISFYFMPVAEAVDNWKMMRDLLDGGDFTKEDDRRTKPDKGVRQRWWDPGWVPFAGNGGGDFFCIDVAPAPAGTRGQVIHFHHDAEKRTLLAPSLRAFLYDLANGLEDGKYRYDEEEGLA
jgi:cell wall assembly regulator SMI1